MWELDYKESWAQRSWCFWTVVLEKTPESPLDCKETQPVHPKGDQSWVFIGKTEVEAETPILWPPDTKSWFIWKDPDTGKDWGQEEKGMTEEEMAGSPTQWAWVWVNSGSWRWTGEPGKLRSTGSKELDTTERLNWGGECAETIIRGCSQLGGAWHVWGTVWVLQDYWNQWAKVVLRPGPTVGSWSVPCLSCPWDGLPSSCGRLPGPSLSALVIASAEGSSARQRSPQGAQPPWLLLEHHPPLLSVLPSLGCSSTGTFSLATEETGLLEGHKKDHKLGGLNNRRLFPYSPGDWKSKTKVSARLMSPEVSLLGL